MSDILMIFFALGLLFLLYVLAMRACNHIESWENGVKWLKRVLALNTALYWSGSLLEFLLWVTEKVINKWAVTI